MFRFVPLCRHGFRHEKVNKPAQAATSMNIIGSSFYRKAY